MLAYLSQFSFYSLVLQLIAIPIFFFQPIGILLSGIVGCVGATFLLIAILAPKASRALRVIGALAAIMAAVGWGSWALVAVKYEPSDPVINIAGLLTLPALALTTLTYLGRPKKGLETLPHQDPNPPS